MKKFVLSIALGCFSLLYLFSQDYKEEQSYKNWGKLVHTFPDEFYVSNEAKRIADNVLLYQLTTGGWPKNIFIPKELTEDEKAKVIKDKSNVNEGTIDNGATTTEIQYLAKVFRHHKDERYKKAIFDGIDYLLEAQYDNGGWPQCYPRTTGYVTQIQYNDNSNVNVLKFMREIYSDKDLYSFVTGDRLERAKKAFDKGIECILKTQVKQNGKLTAWCAQYDHETLLPAKARAYELISLSGQESDDIILLLMSLENPSIEVIDAIEGAVEWLKVVQIEGVKIEYFENEEGKRDRRVVKCENCPPMWARFYDIESNEPFVCDRDGIKQYGVSMSGLSYERRMGYKWFNDDGIKVFDRYEQWKKRNNR